MNRRELVRAVAAQTAQDVKHVETIVSGLTDVITVVVAKGEPVTIQGFAKFAKVERAARIGRNPRTGEQIRIKASKRVRLTPMKAFKDTVMQPSQAPRLERGVWPTAPELLTRQAQERRAASDAARGATKATATKATATKATATKATAKKAAAKKAPARSTAKKAPATRTTKKAPATRTAPARSTAKKAPATRTTKKAASRTR